MGSVLLFTVCAIVLVHAWSGELQDMDATFSDTREFKLLSVRRMHFRPLPGLSWPVLVRASTLGLCCTDMPWLFDTLALAQPCHVLSLLGSVAVCSVLSCSCSAFDGCHSWASFAGVPPQGCAEAMEQGDPDAFTEAIKEFDSMTRLVRPPSPASCGARHGASLRCCVYSWRSDSLAQLSVLLDGFIGP